MRYRVQAHISDAAPQIAPLHPAARALPPTAGRLHGWVLDHIVVAGSCLAKQEQYAMVGGDDSILEDRLGYLR